MGWFSSKSDDNWELEYDRRVNDPNVKKDVMKNPALRGGEEVRVQDDAGVYRRRDGSKCCGCGGWNIDNPKRTYPNQGPVYDHHSHHDADVHDDKPSRRGFLGIF